MEVPSPSEFLFTVSDILNIKLTAKLVVISCCPSNLTSENTNTANGNSSNGEPTYSGLVRLCHALLAAGAHCVLLALWPVPDTAAKILLRAFYSALLQGSRAARFVILTEAFT